MQIRMTTTPCGRRPISLVQVTRQVLSGQIEAGKSAGKWKIYENVSTAMKQLGLQRNSLALLRALVSFYPEDELRQEAQLIVFPSNAKLSQRANSMAGSTMRRHLALLVEAGLIIRRDSSNGKRFPRKGREGEVKTAFGFDLSPMLARAEEFAVLAAGLEAERFELKRMKEDLTIRRRDVRKLIDLAEVEDVPGDWLLFERTYQSLVSQIPRQKSVALLAPALDGMNRLYDEVITALNIWGKIKSASADVTRTEHHLQDTRPVHPSEHDRASGTVKETRCHQPRIPPVMSTNGVSLSAVLKACPEIISYGPGGKISDIRDLMSAAKVVRSSFGISEAVYDEACKIMGPHVVSAVVACLLERAGEIRSLGAYLHGLTKSAKSGQFSLGPMVMARLRSRS